MGDLGLTVPKLVERISDNIRTLLLNTQHTQILTLEVQYIYTFSLTVRCFRILSIIDTVTHTVDRTSGVAIYGCNIETSSAVSVRGFDDSTQSVGMQTRTQAFGKRSNFRLETGRGRSTVYVDGIKPDIQVITIIFTYVHWTG